MYLKVLNVMYRILFYKYKFVFLFFLNLFILTSVYSKKIIIDKEKVGEIKLHMPFKKITEIIGKGKCKLIESHKLAKHFKCLYGAGELTLLFYRPSWFYYYYPKDPSKSGIPFYKNDLTLSTIIIKDPFYRTKYGIGVGSKYFDVFVAYQTTLFEQRYGIPLYPMATFCIPFYAWDIFAKNKNVDVKSIYDYKKKKLKGKPEVIFKDWLVTEIIISNSRLGCDRGD